MLTLSMIVKNEEKFLADCLRSAAGVVDEIVIVDTGSTDNTVKIAESFNAKIFNFNWIDDFSAARNFALDKSSGNWILYLDADERLLPDSISELKKIKFSANDLAYYCTIYNEDHVNKRPSLMTYPRLFPNRKQIRFEGKVHEQLEAALQRNNVKIKQSGIKIIHLGYSDTEEKLKQKAMRNLKILLTDYNTNPSSYIAFQIGQTYGILQQKQDAGKYFHIALQEPGLRKEYVSTALRYLAANEAEKNNINSAYELIKKSIRTDPSQPLALLIAVKICIKLGLYNEAAEYLLKAFNVNLNYLNKQGSTFQSIFLDADSLINECLILAVEIKNKELISKILEVGKDRDYQLYTYYYQLTGAEEYCSPDPEILKKVNPETAISLLQQNPSKPAQLKVLSELKNEFLQNASILSILAALYRESDNHAEAVKTYEALFETKPVDASVIFYLTSLYLQTGVAEKIPPLLQESESYYGNIPEVKAKLAVLKEKLGLLN